MSKLKNDYKVISYDMRGHGTTSLPADHSQMKSWFIYKDDLEKILEINKKLNNHMPTVPSILSDELQCNIFLKAKDLESFFKTERIKGQFLVYKLD